jgi:UDP-2-acetamido-2,6-beta-L-arabino-hexul-4-ose reductase
VKVLVTGAAGFVGRNLVERLKSDDCPEVTEVLEFDRDTDDTLLETYCAECGFVFHLAGVNRPETADEFTEGNVDFTLRLIELLRRHANTCPVLLSSSTQAALDNPYGRSKRAAEDALHAYGRQAGAMVLIYRLPGLFGKWSRPNYNSVVATFCHNIARDVPITIRDPSTRLPLAYIDDVTDEFIAALRGQPNPADDGLHAVPVVCEVALGELARLLQSFRDSRKDLTVPDTADAFMRKLYATYLSYPPTDGFSYLLPTNADDRGSFTEVIRTPDRGQFSVNVIKPGITKGNHWHHTKNEKFVVVSGSGVIRFRKVGEGAVTEYVVSGDSIEVVDIPPGYTHNIENLGATDMVVLMWASECFDPEKPDTYWLAV